MYYVSINGVNGQIFKKNYNNNNEVWDFTSNPTILHTNIVNNIQFFGAL